MIAVQRQSGNCRMKGHSIGGKMKKMRNIDVRRGDTDEERQLGVERGPLASKRERDEEVKNGQK